MNHMQEVCQLFSLDLFEKFNISVVNPYIKYKIRNPYYFTDEGVLNNFGVLQNEIVIDLIIGALTIEKL